MKRYVPLLLVALVLAVYGRSIWFDFVGFDDNLHIIDNPYFHPPTLSHVLTLWRQPYEAYMPATYTMWAVLAKLGMLPTPDAQGVAFNPYVFHLANVLLHATSVLLVWGVLLAVMRGTCGAAADRAAAIGAAVFAVHPLQVESVAWISSGKDVLGGTFALTAMLLYLQFDKMRAPTPPPNPPAPPASPRETIRRPALAWTLYALASIAFVLAFLAKATTIVTPALLAILVLLRRRTLRPAALRWLVPWFLAVPLLAWATARVQSDAALLTWTPLWARPLEAIDAVGFYLSKLAWPAHLAVDYARTPRWVIGHPAGWWLWLIPAAVGAALWQWRRSWPEGIGGAAIVLLALFPVLGFIPFEFQGYSDVADRYMYLPMLGVALAAAGAAARAEGRGFGEAANAIGGLVVAVLAGVAWLQVGVWRDSPTLFSHAVAVVPNSGFGWQGVGNVRERAGDYAGAVDAYRRALAIRPDDLQAMTRLAGALRHTGPPREAALAYAAATGEAARRVLLKFPDNAMAHRRLANALQIEGDAAGSAAEYRKAIAADPADTAAHLEFGQLLQSQGHLERAIAQYRAAARLRPGDAAIGGQLKAAQAQLRRRAGS